MLKGYGGDRVKRLELRRHKPKKFRIGKRLGILCLVAWPLVTVLVLSLHAPATTQDSPALVLPVHVEQAETITMAQRSAPPTRSDSSVRSDNNTNNNTKHAWENSTALPLWMKEYVRWHADQRELLTPDTYAAHKFLVLRCLQTDATCGGASDRLKPLPILVKLAAQSNRLLMIYWNHPCLLQEFLLPPAGGLDWTVPEWMVPQLVASSSSKSSRLYTKVATITKGVHRPTPIVVCRIQDQHGGSEMYNSLESGADSGSVQRAYRKVYRSLFQILFEPSPAVAAALQREMSEAGLVPGQYAAAHLRTAYGNHPIPTRQIRRVAVNAVNCASRLRPGGPVYFTSDSRTANAAMERLAKQQGKSIVSIVRDTEPLHLDKAGSVIPLDYYSIFVDLYLLANADCISHGQGGFGRFGVLLSRNASCFSKFFTAGQYVMCEWKEKDAPEASRLLPLPAGADVRSIASTMP